MTHEQARDNLRQVVDGLRLTKPEYDTLDASLRTLYDAAVSAAEMEKELKDARKPRDIVKPHDVE